MLWRLDVGLPNCQRACFVPWTAGQEWQGQMTAEAASWGISDFGLEVEGPLVRDKLTFRVSANSDSMDGQYTNWANPSETLGARSTEDFSLTLHATPTDRFTARLRLHYWEDDDGETPSIAYGMGNGEDQYNCNLGGTAGPMSGVPGDPNWICGTPRFPKESEIARDSIVTDDIRAALRGDFIPGSNQVLPGFLDHFGLRREAFEASLILDYEFANGMTISSITAAHTNDQARLGDFDYRWTGGSRPGGDVAGVGNRTLEATFALNYTEILSRDSNDAGILLGERELAGLGNQFSRYPRISGTASGTYRSRLTDTTHWFARLDYIYKDGKWATDTNVTKTPKENRINLRVGLEVGEDLRIEAYGTNLTGDDAFTGFQAFNDLAFFGGRRVLTIGLPVKRTYGVRAAYRFDL